MVNTPKYDEMFSSVDKRKQRTDRGNDNEERISPDVKRFESNDDQFELKLKPQRIDCEPMMRKHSEKIGMSTQDYLDRKGQGGGIILETEESEKKETSRLHHIQSQTMKAPGFKDNDTSRDSKK